MGGIVGSLMQIAFWSIILPTAFYLITQIFGSLVYGIGMMFFGVMDLLQSTFRKLAGLEGGVAVSGKTSDDLVTAILSHSTIIDVLISVTVFAIGLIIVASIVQIIRLEYTTEGSKNSKEQIFAKAGKSLVMFILIPIVCFVGIRISNYLLVAVDYATSSSGASTISGCVFSSAAADASKIYDDRNGGFYIDVSNLLGSLVSNIVPSHGNAQVTGSSGNWKIEKFGDYFTSKATSEAEARVDLANKVSQAFTSSTVNSDGKYVIGVKLSEVGGSPWSGTMMTKGDELSYYNINCVGYFYKTSAINYLILFLGCYIGIKTLFTSCMGLIARIYKLAALFVISPAAIGLQPLDDGNAYKKWRGEFIKNVLSCYGIIVAINLYFTIVGVLQTVELWPGFWNYLPNKFVQFMMVLTGATMINDLAGIIGGLIGAGDVNAEGSKIQGDVGKMASGVAKVGMGAMGGAMKGLGGWIKSGYEKHKGGKDGKMSLAAAEKTAGMSDDDITKKAQAAQDKFKKETDGFVQQADGSWVKTTTDAKTGKTKTKTMSKEEYDEKKKVADENTEDALKKKREDTKVALQTDSFYAEQKTKVAQGRAQAMMGRAALGNALNPMQMLGGVDNLLGGVSKYVSGEAFKATDEKYIEELKKQGVDTDALGLEAGKNGPMSTVHNGLGGLFGLNKKKEEALTGAADVKGLVASAQDINANSDLMKSTNAALDRETEKAEQNAAEAAAQKKAIDDKHGGDASKVGSSDGYKEATTEAVDALKEFNKVLEQFASGVASAADVENAKTAARASVGSGEDAAGVEDYFGKVDAVMGAHGADSAAQREAIAGAKFDNATITATLQDKKNDTGVYGTTAEREAYGALSEAEREATDRANDIKTNRNDWINKAAQDAANAQVQETDEFGKPIVDKNGNPVMKSANFGDEFAKNFAEGLRAAGVGGDSDAYDKAMQNLAKTLKDEGIKAKVDGLDESKFKIEDTNIIKSLKDILAAVQATKESKKDDKSEKTLNEILKQLKKNGNGW